MEAKGNLQVLAEGGLELVILLFVCFKGGMGVPELTLFLLPLL